MSEASVKLHRILLPLDVSRDSLTALHVAFDLAKALGAEVSGLFIEDARLLAAGNLPFAREVGSLSGIAKRIGGAEIEHRFRAVASEARKALAEAGERHKVQFSFQIGRGDVPAEILTAATDADIVVLGKAGWSIGAFRKPGSTCLAILSRSRVPVLVVEQGTIVASPILAVNDGTAAGRRVVDFASQLSRSLGWDIAVLSAQVMSSDEVLRISRERPRVVVLPSSLPLAARASQLECAVLFVP